MIYHLSREGAAATLAACLFLAPVTLADPSAASRFQQFYDDPNTSAGAMGRYTACMRAYRQAIRTGNQPASDCAELGRKVSNLITRSTMDQLRADEAASLSTSERYPGMVPDLPHLPETQ